MPISAAARALLMDLAAIDDGTGVLIEADPDVDPLLAELASAFLLDLHRAHGAPGWHAYVMRGASRCASSRVDGV